jgi:Zn-dependent M28 family amino/carboxypeptidase
MRNAECGLRVRASRIRGFRAQFIRNPHSAFRIRLVTLLALVACETAESFAPKTSFNAARAMEYVRTQLEFGPRVPATEGHRRTGDWIAEQMRLRADTVIEQRFSHVTANGDSLPMRNILARIKPAATQRVLYVAHWDTRPVSDKASNPADRAVPVPGANDGASGVALLMAVADVLKMTPPTWGVDLLFVDGEDYGDFTAGRDVLIGAKYFAQHPPAPDYRPLFGVVWDMIGDASLGIYQEGHSVRRAPEIVSRVWQTAADLGYSSVFVPRVGESITDDHVPLLDAGLRVIDVIDIEFAAHHTPFDTIDKVSERSLQVVGDVAVKLLQ